MKSDITRDTFIAAKHFSRVIHQQGRVDVDADSNEQTSILLHYLRTLAVDLIGPHAAPVVGGGFRLEESTDVLTISAGRYYVDGIAVENDTTCLYTEQPYFPVPADDAFAKALIDKLDARYWLYLDAWERHVTSIEDDSIREKALGGPDTCARAKVTWQVRALNMGDTAQEERRAKRRQWLTDKLTALEAQLATSGSPLADKRIQEQIDKVKTQIAFLDTPEPDELAAACPYPLGYLLPISDALLGARVDPGSQIVDACVMAPDSKYRGAENQLYRVEIHRGGIAGEATFKWARDNGSAATAWLGTSGFDLEVADARSFAAGNWIELSDDVFELQGLSGVLARLAKVEGGTLSVDPDSVAKANALHWSEDLINPKVRRWDHFQTEDVVLEADGSILITETPVGTPDDTASWIDLEDGVQVQFAEGGEYRTGDYWLIPARVAAGDIEWPPSESDSMGVMTARVAPHGVVHHFAPLGFVDWENQNLDISSCYCEFEPLSSCFQSGGSIAAGGNLLRNGQLLFGDSARVEAAAEEQTATKATKRRASKKA